MRKEFELEKPTEGDEHRTGESTMDISIYTCMLVHPKWGDFILQIKGFLRKAFG